MAKWPYSDPRWREVRKAVLIRDRYLCQIRGPRCTEVATCVDHIIELADGGPPFDPSNLRASCRADNVAKRNRMLAYRAARRPSRQWITQDAPPPSRDWVTGPRGVPISDGSPTEDPPCLRFSP